MSWPLDYSSGWQLPIGYSDDFVTLVLLLFLSLLLMMMMMMSLPLLYLSSSTGIIFSWVSRRTHIPQWIWTQVGSTYPMSANMRLLHSCTLDGKEHQQHHTHTATIFATSRCQYFTELDEICTMAAWQGQFSGLQLWARTRNPWAILAAQIRLQGFPLHAMISFAQLLSWRAMNPLNKTRTSKSKLDV